MVIAQSNLFWKVKGRKFIVMFVSSDIHIHIIIYDIVIRIVSIVIEMSPHSKPSYESIDV